MHIISTEILHKKQLKEAIKGYEKFFSLCKLRKNRKHCIFSVFLWQFLFCSFPVCWCVVGAGRGNDRRDLSRAVFPIPASFAQVAEFPFSDFAIKFALCLFFAMISNVLESTLHKFLYSNTFSGLEDMLFFFLRNFPAAKMTSE